LVSREIQENLSYIFEMMSKEIRNAQVDENVPGQCPRVRNGEIYNIDSQGGLNFKNKYGECVRYYLSGGRLMIARDKPTRSAFITPVSVKINNLMFLVDDLNNRQPSVAVMLDAEATIRGARTEKMKIQTTIASRHYEPY